MDERYNVVFKGHVDHLSAIDVARAIGNAFKLPDSTVDKLCSKSEIVLKKNAPQDTASRLKLKLESLGALVALVPCRSIVAKSASKDSLEGPKSKLELVPVAEKPTRGVPEQTDDVEDANIYTQDGAGGEEGKRIVRKHFLSFFVSILSGAIWLLLGLVLMMAFSPFPDGGIRRGMIIGVLLSLFGLYRILMRNRYA